jgi:hypothetical protein
VAAAGVGKTAAPKISQMGALLGLAAVLQPDFLLLAVMEAKMLPALTGPPTVVAEEVGPEQQLQISRAETEAPVW